jgi:putative endonuclease
MYTVYLLECVDGTIYTGIATDVIRRFEEHKAGKGASYTRSHKPKQILYTEECLDRSSALKREAEIKKLPRSAKILLVASTGFAVVK